MVWELELALAASPREWALRLHRHVADHGGARVRATVLQPGDALEEPFDILVVDDTTSYLNARLVQQLHALGRCVLGVFDPDDPRGKGELTDLGVDDVIDRGASPEQFLAALHALAPRCRRSRGNGAGAATGQVGEGRSARPESGAGQAGVDRSQPRGQLTAVAGVSGGTGATEAAIALAAAAAARGEAVTLVDADEVAPSIAQRLDLPQYPNLRAAADVLERTDGAVAGLLARHRPTRLAVLPGLASGRDWLELRPGEVVGVLAALARSSHQVVVNAGPSLEDLPAGGAGARFGQTRAVLGGADAILAVTLASPVGIARLLDWVAALAGVATAPLWVVCNRAPGSRFRRAEVTAEIARNLPGVPVAFLPADARVATAAWAGTAVRSGPFTRAAGRLAHDVLPPGGHPGRAAGRRPARVRVGVP